MMRQFKSKYLPFIPFAFGLHGMILNRVNPDLAWPSMLFVAISILVVLLFQHYLITRESVLEGEYSENTGLSTWHSVYFFYKNIVHRTFWISFALLIITCNLAAFLNPSFTESYEIFFQENSLLLLTLGSFFVGFVKLFISNQETPLIKGPDQRKDSNDNSNISFNTIFQDYLSKEWIPWFIFLTAFPIIGNILLSAHTDFDLLAHFRNTHALFRGSIVFAINFALFSIWNIWIFILITEVVLEKHGFRNFTIIKKFQPWLAETDEILQSDLPPFQAIVIGPAQSGKTTLVKTFASHYFEPSGKEISPSQFNKNTAYGNTRYFYATFPFIFYSEDGGTTQSATCYMWDTAGENIGDHIFLPLNYRSDLLVIVIRLSWLKTDNEEPDKSIFKNDMLWDIRTPLFEYLFNFCKCLP